MRCSLWNCAAPAQSWAKAIKRASWEGRGLETGAGRSLAARERGGVEAEFKSPQNSRSLRGVAEEGVA